MDYVVEVKEVPPNHIWKDVKVTIWKGNGLEDTKHSEYFLYFEQAFKFVEEFSKQKFFDQVVEEYFKGTSNEKTKIQYNQSFKSK